MRIRELKRTCVRERAASVTGLAVGDTIGDQNFKFSNNPGKGGGPGGTCSGDSGGPAFWIDPLIRRRVSEGVNS